MKDLYKMSALELSEAIKSKQLSVTEVTTAFLSKAKENKYNAFISVNEENALKRAAELEQQLQQNGSCCNSPLFGVPIAIKDNIVTKGIPTTCSSKMLSENHTPVYNATVIEKIEAAGMVIIGKLNMDEFAMGGSSETGSFGKVINPHNSECVAGGSSGGSAAAVAGGEVPIALGSDTGGSIRQPCSFCGVTGIKPTYGAVSRYGLIAYASSLDQIGTIAKNVEDAAALLEIISGCDSKDSTCSIKEPFAFTNNTDNLKGIKIGLPVNYFEKGINEQVKNAVLSSVKAFEQAGATVEEFEMPLIDYIVATYYIIACAEASSNLSRYDGLKYGYRSGKADSLSDVYKYSRSEGFGLEVKRRIMLGSFVLSSGYYDAYYKKALQTQKLLKKEYNRLFGKYDMVISPVAPTAAYKFGENIDDPMKMYMGDIYTVSVNLAGLPAVSLPCGVTTDGLPIGFQLIGDSFEEEKLINAARVFQKNTGGEQK